MIRVPMSDLAPGERELDAAQARYVLRVHRLKHGDAFVAFDGKRGLECDAVVVRAQRARLGEPRPAAVVAPRRITWIHAFPKADKADAIVRDATELGASRIVFVPSERSVAQPKAARIERWMRIAEQASRQCGRGDVPDVALGTAWKATLEEAHADARICLDPRGRSLREVLSGAKTSLAFACGPEGGLTDAELDVARALGFEACKLGALVMRTETSPAAVLGAVALLSV
jgi:16S rRNA (uracil1498-N3)-methyltransferase